MKANPIKFNQKDAETFDKRAKDTIIELLSEYPYRAMENPNKYGIDILLFYDEIFTRSIEVETKRSFTTWDSLYPKIHIPERKRKFFTDSRSYFILLNLYFDKFLFIKGSKILECEVTNKFTSRSTVILDKFFQVPLEKFIKLEIENGKFLKVEEE